MEKRAPLPAQQVEEFVLRAHSDLDRVREMLNSEPALIHASWDWGADWETGLGAAAHMGRRDIAEYLLEQGARMDLFAAAMLNRVEIVRTILQDYPAARYTLGAHGIPLLAHAQAGDAQAVIDFLQSLETTR